jgi:hypothetical protein
VSLIAELAWPLPSMPTVEGTPFSPKALDDLVRKTPGYEWKMELLDALLLRLRVASLAARAVPRCGVGDDRGSLRDLVGG